MLYAHTKAHCCLGIRSTTVLISSISFFNLLYVRTFLLVLLNACLNRKGGYKWINNFFIIFEYIIQTHYDSASTFYAKKLCFISAISRCNWECLPICNFSIIRHRIISSCRKNSFDVNGVHQGG